MLVIARMNRLALAAVVLAATATTASAGGFVGLGIGNSPTTSSDIGFQTGGDSGRLELGYRFGHFSVEGMGSKATIASYYGLPTGWTSLAVAGKYNANLGDRFEAFGRLGYQSTSVDIDQANDHYSGSGILFGGGFEYGLNLGIGAKLFVDYTIARSHLTNPARDNQSWDMTSRVWTLGASINF